MLTVSGDCKGTKARVDHIVSDGISSLATDSGSRYVWGTSPSDFVPEGGLYTVCWCSNIGDLLCETSANFLLTAGELLIIGPLTHQFQCVRGHDCDLLQPFQGYGLLADDHLMIQRDACGSAALTKLSPSNLQGTGHFYDLGGSGTFTTLILSFGTSDAENDFHFDIDASQRALIWFVQLSSTV